MRNTLARRFRVTVGRAAKAAKGALGISSETCAVEGMERRTATSIPPAETLRAVANSRNSLSASVLLRTKTGMAKGKRGHCRRSAVGVLPFTPTHTPSCQVLTLHFKHLGGQILIKGGNPRRHREETKRGAVNFGCGEA